MEFILKSLSPQLLLMLLPMLLLRAGAFFKNRDTNQSGSDDAFGNVLTALAPAVAAFEQNNDTAVKKYLRVVYETLGNYLNTHPPIGELKKTDARDMSL